MKTHLIPDLQPPEDDGMEYPAIAARKSQERMHASSAQFASTPVVHSEETHPVPDLPMRNFLRVVFNH